MDKEWCTAFKIDELHAYWELASVELIDILPYYPLQICFHQVRHGIA